MFCPKCGNQVSSSAPFCDGCGASLTHVAKPTSFTMSYDAQKAVSRMTPAAAPAAVSYAAPAVPLATPRAIPAMAPAAASYAAPAAAAPRTSYVAPAASAALPTRIPMATSAKAQSTIDAGIVARIAAGATIICMVLPWLEAPILKTVDKYSSYLSIDMPNDYWFTMYNMGDLTSMLDSITSVGIFGALHGILLGIWFFVLMALVAGLVISFVGERKSTRPLIIGGLLASVIAGLWFAFVNLLNGQVAPVVSYMLGASGSVRVLAAPVFVPLTALLGVVVVVFAIADKKKA